jgi:hypothetical protein
VACGPSGGDGVDETCLHPLEITLSNVVIDGSASTTSPTLTFEMLVTNPSTSTAQIVGYLFECVYLDGSGALLRTSGTLSMALGPGETDGYAEPGNLPGVVDWSHGPTGDGLRCTVEVLYSFVDCEGAPPSAVDNAAGADDITVLAP